MLFFVLLFVICQVSNQLICITVMAYIFTRERIKLVEPPSTWSIAAHQSQTLPADDICAVPVDIT